MKICFETSIYRYWLRTNQTNSASRSLLSVSMQVQIELQHNAINFQQCQYIFVLRSCIGLKSRKEHRSMKFSEKNYYKTLCDASGDSDSCDSSLVFVFNDFIQYLIYEHVNPLLWLNLVYRVHYVHDVIKH